MSKYNFNFVDLFAGIGGFHQAMRFLGGKCVMAAEIDPSCIETYKLNFPKTNMRGDVNEIEPKSIPDFGVLCAGFPCQPFSKAGAQKGFKDKSRGNLFYSIMNILDSHPETKFVILENVRNLADKTDNWNIIKDEFIKRNFYITETPVILSPSNFRIPQIRERTYILGIRKDIRNKEILTNGYIHISDLGLEELQQKNCCELGDAWTILENNVPDKYIISDEKELMINAWDEFRINTGITVLGFPIWINCFGVGINDTDYFLSELDYENIPNWKQRFVNLNRNFYLSNKLFIDKWIEKYDMLSRIKLYKKFEWNCGIDCGDMHDTIIQIRQSGIRVKRPTHYPSLVAMVNTPIVWDRNKEHYRFITPREAANLQSFHKKFKFLGTDKQIYRQLGNSVNVKLIKIIAKNLFRLGLWD